MNDDPAGLDGFRLDCPDARLPRRLQPRDAPSVELNRAELATEARRRQNMINDAQRRGIHHWQGILRERAED